MSRGYYTCTRAHLTFLPKGILCHETTLSANLLSDDSSELNCSTQLERIPQQQQAENEAPHRARQGENGTDSRIPVFCLCHDSWGGERLLVTAVTGQALQLSTVAPSCPSCKWPLNNEVYHRTIEMLFGRDRWWPANPTSRSMQDCQQC